MRENLASIGRAVRAMLAFQAAGAIVFDNGNLIRTQATEAGVEGAFAIPIFTEAFLRPLFCKAIGPFRWIALSGDEDDIRKIDDLVLALFPHNAIVARWIALARNAVPFEGLPARIAWLGHGERTELALAVNDMVADGHLAGPVAFTRDHLDAGAMTHPFIMTENMHDGSDAISDWPLLNAMAMCSSQADLVAIHSGGGGYSGFMTSAGVTIVADGTAEAGERIKLALDNDTSLGIMRYADAGYPEAQEAARVNSLSHFRL
jgi:urocanate hydratase